MSIGSWTLTVFSGSAAAALFAGLVGRSRIFPLRAIGSASQLMATLSGLPLATYTGVLLGATAIPVWSANVTGLPIHFAASGLGAAVSLIELKGHTADCALNRLGIGSAVAETAITVRSLARRAPALSPIKSGRVGWISRAGGFLSGPLPLALRLLAGNSGTGRSRNLRRAAAVSAIAGSMLTRYAWVQAGRASALDPALPMQLRPEPVPQRAEAQQPTLITPSRRGEA
jgi:protein NrfD